MSLISTKNLVAPLTNKLHMIAILLLTVGFVALRLSGGSVRLQNSGSRADRKAADDLIDLPIRGNQAPGGAAGHKTTGSNENFQKIIKEVRPPWEHRKAADSPPPSSAPAKKKGGLDDIEKALGLK